ncbi:5466_t:CDS:2 [Entrophospora sp. SA101]|nr:5466_t:CDS:2 [Entrophospora sp. SA101]
MVKDEITLYYVGEGVLEVTSQIKEIKTGGENIYNHQLTKVSTIDEDERCGDN